MVLLVVSVVVRSESLVYILCGRAYFVVLPLVVSVVVRSELLVYVLYALPFGPATAGGFAGLCLLPVASSVLTALCSHQFLFASLPKGSLSGPRGVGGARLSCYPAFFLLCDRSHRIVRIGC